MLSTRSNLCAPSIARAQYSGSDGGADEGDDRVDICHGDGQADQNMGALARLSSVHISCGATNGFFAEFDKGGNKIAQR